LVFALGLLFWGYWPQWISLWQTWQSDPDYNHGFLVVPISVWLLWQRRARLALIEIAPSWWGVGLILVAALLTWAGAEFFLPQIETWSIPVWVAGVVLLFGGWSLLRWSGGAIAFLWFMTPLPDSMIGFVSLPLQKCSAALSTWTLHLFAQPAVRFGTTISLGEHVLEVERACSGLRICYGIMALAVAYVVLTRPRPLRAIILLALALPVAILANSARVTGTGLLFLVVSGEKAHQYAHDFSGLLMMPFAVFLFWLAHKAMEKMIGAFERSSRAGNMLVLKSGLAVLIVATGLVLWQRRQADAAVGTLLKIAEGHETEGQRLQDDKKPVEAVQEWVQAIGVLDRYCRVRPDDAQAALRLARVSEKLAFTKSREIRAARYYERAWSLLPDDNELGLKQARLALAGEDLQLALEAAEKLLLQTDSGSSEHLEAFKIKIQAQIQDAGRSNPKTTWTQVAESLQQGIEGRMEAVSCSYQLALLYRQRPIGSIDETQREVAAEQVLSDLLTSRPDDPMARFARYAFHQQYPAPDRVTTTNGDTNSGSRPDSDPGQSTNLGEDKTAVVGAPSQTPDADLDRAIELATGKITSDTHPLWLAAGSRELARKDLTKARQYFRSAIQAMPTHVLAYLQLARLESALDIDSNPAKEVTPEQRQAAIAVLKDGLAQEELKDNKALRVELIRQQLQTSDATNIADANQEILKLKSEFKNFTPEIGVPLQLELTALESQIYADAGDFEKAARLLDPVLNSKEVMGMKAGSGLLSSSWIALGSYYEQQGLSEQASNCFLQAKTLEPASIHTAWREAFTAERELNASVAADLYEDIAARLGNRPEPWLALARSELRQQLAKATSQQDFRRLNFALEKAVNLGAPEVDSAAMYSEIAAATGDIKQAISILENAASRNPDSAEVWQMLALRRQASGDSPGAMDALAHYQKTVADPLKAVLLESNLQILAQNLDNAQMVATAALQTAVNLEDQRQLQEQLVRIELLSNRPQAAQQRLQNFAEQHPGDIKTKVQLANFYFGQGRFDLMEQMEQQIKELEGESGASWLTLRARRLLQLAGRTQVAQERSDILAEAGKLLELLPVHRPETRELQGQMALQDGRLADAAGHFEAAWNQGYRNPRLGTELIFALQASGNAAKSEYYLTQMQDMLSSSPHLFDMALAAKSSSSFSDLNRSTQIVQNWVESINDADAYLRLARTLRLKNVPAGPQQTQWLQEIEMAYRKAIELAPKNSQAWGEFLSFLNTDRKELDRTVSELNAFTQNSEIAELDRSFVTSLLLAELDLQQQAARYWTSTIELASQATDQQAQNRVLVQAARFFAGPDSSQAISLARQALALNLNDVTSLRLLTALLSDTNSVTSLKEASTLLDSLPEVREWLNSPLATDPDNPIIDRISVPDKRIIASVLYRRAVLLPT
jgi:exosortase